MANRLHMENLKRIDRLEIKTDMNTLSPAQLEWVNRYDDATKAYLKNAEVNELSRQTIGNYERRIGFFRVYMVDEQKCARVTPEVMFAYREWLLEVRNLSVSSVRQYLREIISFLNWCTWEEHPYFTDIELPKHIMPKAKRKPYTRILTKEEIEKLANIKQTKYGVKASSYYLRRRAVCIVMLMLGLRCSEVVGLDVQDIDLNKGTLYVRHGKGDKQRLLKMPKPVYDAVQMYMEEGDHPDFHLDENKTLALFGIVRPTDGSWKRVSRSDVYDIAGVYTKETIGRKLNPHALRHAAASFTYLNGASLEEVRQFLGHSDQTTTKIYLQKLFQTVSAPGIETIWDRFSYDSEKAVRAVEEQIGVKIRKNVVERNYLMIATNDEGEEFELDIMAESEESARLKALVYCNRNGLKLAERTDGKYRMRERKVKEG